MTTRTTFQFLRFVLGLILLSSLVLGETTPASAALRCYVKANATGSNTGTSWTDAFIDLHSALGTSPCTEVWVAKGTYRPTGGTDRAISFVLKNGVALYGGFAGNETLLTQRKPAANATILSGNIGNTAIVTDNSYHVVVGSGTNSTARLDGFTITAGRADDSGPEWSFDGGGMFNEGGSPSLANLIFSGNSSVERGGGMFNKSGTPSLVNVTFRGNSADQEGGGMSNFQGGTASLINVTFSANWAPLGGGMGNYQSSPGLTNVTFSGNSAQWGGGMGNYQSSPSLTNVTLSGNSATNGGGVYNSSSSPIITNSILYGDYGGEIYNLNNSVPTVRFSIVLAGYPGTGNLNANPLLGPLSNNGGTTRTHALGSGSPAIDKGTNTGCPAKDQRGIARPQGPRCDMGAYEYPQRNLTLFSAGAHDGVIQEFSETSGTGGAMDATAETFAMGDDAADRQGRSILSFNTAALPDNAVITSVTLKIKKAGLAGTDPFTTHGNLLVDVRTGAFSNNAALQLSDFQALANKNAVMTILNNPVNGWYSKAMAAANFIYINKVGLTQFRLRFALDDNDDMSADYLKFYSGNYPTAADRPTLTINYYTP